MRSIIGLVLWASFTGATAAQQSSVELRFDSLVLEVGESVGGELACNNMPMPDAPALTAPPGLELTIGTPSSSQRVSIVNGRKSQQTSYVYPLKLTALREGQYGLGPFSLTAGGRAFSTNAVVLQVKPPAVSSRAEGDSFMFASVDVDRTSLYVSETFTATLRIGIRKVEHRGRLVDLDMLRRVLDLGSSQLSVFAGGNARQSELQLRDSSGKFHRYVIYEVVQTLKAEEVGVVLVGPVFLKANYPTQLQQGFFGNLEVTSTRRETARTESISVQVKPPPDLGRPADFSGAIGTFSMHATARPTVVTLGQPVTLEIKLLGEPLDGVAAPNLAKHPELASRFDFTKEELTGDLEGGAKVFRRAIFPKQAGEQSIPSISWSYFDAKKEQYVTLRSQPIALVVNQPAAGSAPIVIEDIPTEAADETKLTLVAGGLAPICTDVDRMLASQAMEFTPPLIATLAASPLICLGATLLTKHRARVRGDRGFARRRRAEAAAGKLIRESAQAADPGQRLAYLAQALSGYVADRFDLPPGQVTAADAAQALRRTGVDPNLVDQVRTFLEHCDGARYGVGSSRDVPHATAVEQVRGWIRQLERLRG